MNPIAIDFETFFSKKLKYGLKTEIAETYCRSELFSCYLVSVSDGSAVWSGHPKDFNWASLEGHTLLSHNRYFDNTVYNELVRRQLAPKLVIPAWHCTANLTAYLCNRRSLKEATEFLLHENVSKDYRETADGKRWEDWNEAERAQILQAGRVDAVRCWQLWDKFSSRWPEIEQRLSNITIDQGMYGVQIDTALLDQYIVDVHAMRTNTEKIIPWIADSEDDSWDEFNTKPTSTKCITEQCRRVKIPCAPVKSDDEEAYEEWETQYSPQHPWIKAVGAWRSINKLYTTFLTMKKRLRSDGTMPFALKYFGGHTGRWSGDAKINFQNMRKHPLFGNEHGLMETDDKRTLAAEEYKDENGKWPEWVRSAVDFRALIIPRPGKKMIASDLSQIEPRVLAWLTGNTEMMKRIADGMSVYEAFARTTMGYTGPKMDKKTDFYKRIKIQVLQLGYQAGWQKFISTALKEGGLDLTADDPEFIEVENPFTGEMEQKSGYGFTSKKIVESFRAQNPRITALWNKLDIAFKSSVGDSFVMSLPSGRKMTYERVRAGIRIVKDPETGKPWRRTEYSAEVGGRRRACYGGKLAENITQAVARDVFAWHVANMDLRGWWNLFSSHDEAVLEVDPSVTAAEVEAEMSKCPDWLPGCPIAAEAREIQHYLK